jgi:polyisoprenoid-binding protein YceI
MTIHDTNEPAQLASTGIVLTPGRYRLDRTLTSVRFSARKFGVFTIRGSVSVVAGEFTVGPRLEDSTLHAVLDAATFRTPMATRDEHVHGESLLDVARFPSMEFDSTGVANTAEGWEIRGLLTVHGKVAPAVLAVSSAGQEGALVRVEARTRVDRRAFGVTRMRAAASAHVDVKIHAVGTLT